MLRLIWLTVVVTLLYCSTPLTGGPPRTHTITIDDYFTQADIFDQQIAPDGNLIAYSEGRWYKSLNERRADLWLVERLGRKIRRLTSDQANDRSLQWSSDGRFLYTLANRKREGEKRPPYDGRTQVWRINPQGGEPQAITAVDGGVLGFALNPSSHELYLLTHREDIDNDPWRRLREQYKHIEYGHGIEKYTVVWKLNLLNFRTEKVIDERRVIRELAVAPHTGRVGMITTPDSKVVSFEGQSRVDVWDPATGKITTLPDKVFRKDLPSPYGWLEKLAWSSDGRRLAFNVIFDAYPSEVVVAEWTGDTPQVFLLSRPPGVSLHGYGSPLAWRGPSTLCFLGDEKARVRLYAASNIHPGGKPQYRVLTLGDVVVNSFSFTSSGEFGSAVMQDVTHLPDIYDLSGKDGPLRLTNVNPQVDTWKLPQIKTVAWRGANGDPVEGILELPPDYQPGQPLPLVVEIHGGPTTSAHLKLQYWIYGRTLLPARGYALLAPNYRGSTGYGDKFLTDLIGKENNLDVEDILKGVDALVERGIADPERLAVMGWSNGGYLTNCIITKTTRFKAAISGAGIVDAVMEFGGNDEPAYAISFKQGFPWNNPQKYHQASPTYQLDRIRTPTLIHVGANDERCPPSHSRMLYRALKEYVHVPVELLVYPGEGHGLTKYTNRRAKLEWDLAWLDRWVLGKR